MVGEEWAEEVGEKSSVARQWAREELGFRWEGILASEPLAGPLQKLPAVTRLAPTESNRGFISSNEIILTLQRLCFLLPHCLVLLVLSSSSWFFVCVRDPYR